MARDDIGRFTDLTPKIDNTGQIVSAEDINKLQELIERLEREGFRQQDEDFIRMLVDTFEHNPDMNSMWVELLQDDRHIDLHNSLSTAYNPNEYGVCMTGDAALGYMTSKGYVPASRCNIEKVMLFVRDYVPGEDGIVYELSNNGLDFFPVIPNTGEVIQLKTDGSRLYLRAKFKRNPVSPGPRLDAWAVLYYDSTLYVNLDEHEEADLDFEDPTLPPPPPPPPPPKPQLYHNELLEIGPDDHHPKIHRHSGEPGENDRIDLVQEVKNVLWWEHLPPELRPDEGYIKLTRAPALDDRLVKVEAPGWTVDLVYEGERLVQAVRNAPDVTVTNTLDWQSYTYIDGTTEDVVAGVQITREEVSGS